MAYKIVWTKRASERLSVLVDYLEAEWGSNVAQEFVQKVFGSVDLLAEFPEMGSTEVKEKGIRGFLISNQTKLFYRIKAKRIILLALFDTRQHPSRKIY